MFGSPANVDQSLSRGVSCTKTARFRHRPNKTTECQPTFNQLIDGVSRRCQVFGNVAAAGVFSTSGQSRTLEGPPGGGGLYATRQVSWSGIPYRCSYLLEDGVHVHNNFADVCPRAIRDARERERARERVLMPERESAPTKKAIPCERDIVLDAHLPTKQATPPSFREPVCAHVSI